MKVRSLIPAIPERPRCQATRSTRYSNDTYSTDKQCQHRASFRVGLEYFCKRHAEQKVMTAALKESK